MTLAKVREHAVSAGVPLVPETLLPAGFTAWPAEDSDFQLAFGSVKGFRRVERGKVEEVRPYSRDEQRARNWWLPDSGSGRGPGAASRSPVTPGSGHAYKGDGLVYGRSADVRVGFMHPVSLGKVERRGVLWHGIHEDGTDTGGKATRQLAVGTLEDYHNQMAARRANPERIAELERQVRELDPLEQFSREQELKTAAPRQLRERQAGDGVSGWDKEATHELQLRGLRGYHDQGWRQAYYASKSDPEARKTLLEEGTAHARLASAGSGLLKLAMVPVKEFTRVERGRQEVVRQHTENRLDNWPHPPAVGGHQVQAVYTHPGTPHAMYDLGNGLHAEGRPGRGAAAGGFRPGPVMRSNTGLDVKALAEKGWTQAKPPQAAEAAKERWASTRQDWKPGAKGTAQPEGKLAKVRAAGAKTAAKPALPWTQQGARFIPREHAGISRDQMPQLAGNGPDGKFLDLRDAFARHLEQHGVGVSRERVPAWALRSSQSEINASKVRGLADLVRSGDPDAVKSMDRPVMVSRDHYVLDGHHKWAGRAELDARGGAESLHPEGLRTIKVDLPRDQALAKMREFAAQRGIAPRGVKETAGAGAKATEPPKGKDELATALGKITAANKGGYAPLSDEQYHAYAAKLEAALGKAMHPDAGVTTNITHTLNGEGKFWDEDRRQVHDEIIKQFLDKYKDVPAEGKAIIAGGLGGAGKSTVLSKDPDVKAGKYAVVNPDDIKEELARRGLVPKLPGMPEATPMERSALVHEESSHVAKQLARQLQAQHKNMVWDITMSTPGGVESRISQLHENGYGHVHGVFVHIPPEDSVKSAQGRHRDGLEAYRKGDSPLGERYVPSGIIRSAAREHGRSQNLDTFENLKPKFDSWEQWDRTGGGSARHVAAGGTKAQVGSPGKA